MYEHGKEIANTVREVRNLISQIWDGGYHEIQVGDQTIVAHNRRAWCEDTILNYNGDHGSYWILPPRDALSPSLDGFMCIVGMPEVWRGVEMHFISGHVIGKCKEDCIHVTTLADCRTPDMRERMALDLSEGGEDE